MPGVKGRGSREAAALSFRRSGPAVAAHGSLPTDPSSLTEAVRETLDEIAADKKLGVAGLKLCLCLLASCGKGAVRVTASEVCDSSGRVRTESPRLLKSLIMRKLCANQGLLKQRIISESSANLKATVQTFFWLSTVFTILDMMGELLQMSDDLGPNPLWWLFATVVAAVKASPVWLASGGWWVFVPIKDAIKDLETCCQQLLGADRLVSSVPPSADGGASEDRRIRAVVLRECRSATMFAVLSPLGEPLSASQMRAVHSGMVGSGNAVLAGAYGDCSLDGSKPPGVVATVLGIPGWVIGNLIIRGRRAISA